MSEIETVTVSSPIVLATAVQSVEVAEEWKKLHFITGIGITSKW